MNSSKLRKIFSLFILLFMLISNFQIGTIYALEKEKVEREQEKNVLILDKVENIVENTIEKIDSKTRNKDIKNRLEEKQKEVKEYLEKVKEEIKDESSSFEMKEKSKEAIKVVVLKVIS